jgi:hypothetical protein
MVLHVLTKWRIANTRWCEDDVNNKFDFLKGFVGGGSPINYYNEMAPWILDEVNATTLVKFARDTLGVKGPPKKWNDRLLLVNHWLLLVHPPQLHVAFIYFH